MPYSSINDLPDAVKKKLSTEQQKMWMSVFNSAYDEYKGDEAKAFATAWAAVKKKYNLGANMDYHDIIELRGKKVTELKDANGEVKSKTYHDVTLLASGAWVDSKTRQKRHYSDEVLEKYANNWISNKVCVDHKHGVLDFIGDVINPHYEKGRVVGDIVINTLTQTAKDVMALIDNGKVNAVSTEVEIVGEKYNEKAQVYDATEIRFWGQSIVTQGACSLCTLSLFEVNKNAEYVLDEEKYISQHHTDNGEVIWNNVVKEMSLLFLEDTIPQSQRKKVYEDLRGHYKEHGVECPKYHNIIKINDTFFDDVSGLSAEKKETLLNEFYKKDEFMVEEKDIKELSALSIDELSEKNEGVKTLVQAKTTCEVNTIELQARLDKDIKEKEDKIKALENRIKELEEMKIERTTVELKKEEVEEVQSAFIWDSATKGVVLR